MSIQCWYHARREMLNIDICKFKNYAHLSNAWATLEEEQRPVSEGVSFQLVQYLLIFSLMEKLEH